MKAPLFHVGQAVTLIRPIKNVLPGSNGADPKMGQIVFITELTPDYGLNTWFLTFEINPTNEFWEEDYRAVELLPDEALAELLEEVFTPVNV